MKKYDDNKATVAVAVEAKPTIKQIATVLACPVERVRSIAKKPIPGQPYDPKSVNWAAMDMFIQNRLEKTGYESVEAVYAAALEVVVAERVYAGGAGKKMLDIEGNTTTPERKLEVKVGDMIVQKHTGAKFVVTYVDPTIVVYKPEAEEGKLTLSAAIGNRNFNSKFALAE